MSPPFQSTALSSPTIVALPPLPSSVSPNSHVASTRVSSTWDPDSSSSHCRSCHEPFDPFLNRRHHCRLCGQLFCHRCSDSRSLIPPSAIVLPNTTNSTITYIRVEHRDSSVYAEDDERLFGQQLERRVLLARQPQRTCHGCRLRLEPLQEELCQKNSNAMRYNYIDEGHFLRRLLNSPLAFTLGHEVRKAAYALTNLLPEAAVSFRRGGFQTIENFNGHNQQQHSQHSGCQGAAIDPTLRNIDRMHIPYNLLQRAQGIAILTCAKTGLGFAGIEFGTGLVVAKRRGEEGQPLVDSWSAPSAIAVLGLAWGALLGAQVSDHVFLLMTEDALRLFSSEDGRSVQLGVDVGVAVGPVGRSAEADWGATTSYSQTSMSGSGIAMAPIYTYSLSKGMYAGVSMDGRMVVTRPRVNESFYGRKVTPYELLSGQVSNPTAAQPLYDALQRCRVYGSHNGKVNTDAGEDTHQGCGSGSGSGTLLERWSHTTGVGMPIASPSHASSINPYNLSGRSDDAWLPTFSD